MTAKRKIIPRERFIDGVEINRAKLWLYCKRAAAGSKQRAKLLCVAHDIDEFYIDELVMDQGYRCAVSSIVMEAAGERNPFGPSLDRITPTAGYVKGNVRVVCQIVNFAMNSWGIDALERLVSKMGENRRRTKVGYVTHGQKNILASTTT